MKCIYCERPNDGEHKDWCPARNSPLTMAESMMIMGIAREMVGKIINEEKEKGLIKERTQKEK